MSHVPDVTSTLPRAESIRTVRDPICGMEIDPARAYAVRTLADEKVYLCSASCLQQFERTHATSATTGVTDDDGSRWIDLPVGNLHGRHAGVRLTDVIEALPGVRAAPG